MGLGTIKVGFPPQVSSFQVPDYITILDYVHGTDVLFRSNKAYQRHIMSLETTPLREIFPDENVKKID